MSVLGYKKPEAEIPSGTSTPGLNGYRVTLDSLYVRSTALSYVLQLYLADPLAVRAAERKPEPSGEFMDPYRKPLAA